MITEIFVEEEKETYCGVLAQKWLFIGDLVESWLASPIWWVRMYSMFTCTRRNLKKRQEEWVNVKNKAKAGLPLHSEIRMGERHMRKPISDIQLYMNERTREQNARWSVAGVACKWVLSIKLAGIYHIPPYRNHFRTSETSRKWTSSRRCWLTQVYSMNLIA